MSKVLVLAVHPDDETLGCGGTLLKHKTNGDGIYWFIATSIKEECGFAKERIQARKKEIETVKAIYGFNDVLKLEIPTTKAKEFPMDVLIRNISKVFNEVKPEIIYLPFMQDVHSDHRVLFQAAYSCTKTFRYPFIKRIFMMETLSETEVAPSMKEFAFTPNYFVDISDFLDKKIEIMKVYSNELGKSPFPRSAKNIKALATFRGAMAGFKYAESFMVLKQIW